MDQDRPLAIVQASPVRRWAGISCLVGLGIMLLYLMVAAQPTFGFRVMLLVSGLGALALAELMRRSTGHAIHLTPEALRDSDGTVLARLDDIERVESGAFALKPSNGFALRLKRSRGRAWRPGLWWSLGRRVAVGGVAPGHQTKAMAEMIVLRMSERGSGSGD